MGDDAWDDSVRRKAGIARMFYVGRHGRRADAPPPPGDDVYALVSEIIDPDEVLFFNWTPRLSGRSGEIVLVTAQALTHIVYRAADEMPATDDARSPAHAHAVTAGAVTYESGAHSDHDGHADHREFGDHGTFGDHGDFGDRDNPATSNGASGRGLPASDPTSDPASDPASDFAAGALQNPAVPAPSTRTADPASGATDIAVHRLSHVRSLRWSAQHRSSPTGHAHPRGIVIVGEDWEVVVSDSHTLGPAEQLPAFTHLSQILDLA